MRISHGAKHDLRNPLTKIDILSESKLVFAAYACAPQFCHYSHWIACEYESAVMPLCGALCMCMIVCVRTLVYVWWLLVSVRMISIHLCLCLNLFEWILTMYLCMAHSTCLSRQIRIQFEYVKINGLHLSGKFVHFFSVIFLSICFLCPGQSFWYVSKSKGSLCSTDPNFWHKTNIFA